MTLRVMHPVWRMLLAGAAAAMVGCSSESGAQDVRLDSGEPFTARLDARPPRRGGLSAVSLDLDVTAPGVATATIRRVSLGRTDGAYSWDWKGANSANLSFVDLTKPMRQDGAVRAWEVDVSEPARMRLKVWRDWDTEWRVVAQSPEVAVTPGLNHFALLPMLPVGAGDYVGLFMSAPSLKVSGPLGFGLAPDLRDQSAVNLAWSSARGLQYDIAGDAACGAEAAAQAAPNPGYSFAVFLNSAGAPDAVPEPARLLSTVPLSVLNLEKEILVDETLGSREVIADAPSAIRLKV